jgi:predicted NACHT family NTPase
MARRTLQASTQGIKDIRKALKRKQGGQTYLAGAVHCSRQTIWSLLQGNPIDCDVFMNVCTELGLKWEDIAEPEAAEAVQNKDSNLNALVQEVRSRLLPFITAPHSIIGTMRMFSVSQPVPVDKIYIDLNVLEQVSSSRHFSNWRGEYEPGNRQDFDRLSLSKVKQKGVEAISVIKNYAKLLVLGKPGAGKTTFLKSLAVKCIQPEEKFFADLVPLFVTLPEFAKMAHKTSWDLFDYLASELAKQSNRCDAMPKRF